MCVIKYEVKDNVVFHTNAIEHAFFSFENQ